MSDHPQKSTRNRRPNTEMVRCWLCHLSCPPGTATKQWRCSPRRTDWRCIDIGACCARARTAGLTPKDLLALPVAKEPSAAPARTGSDTKSLNDKLAEAVRDFLWEAEYLSRTIALRFTRTGELPKETADAIRLLAPFTWSGAWCGEKQTFGAGSFFGFLESFARAVGWATREGTVPMGDLDPLFTWEREDED